MKLKFVYGILPVIIVYQNWFIKSWADGQFFMFLPIAFIRPEHKGTTIGADMEIHEMVHAKQWYRTLSLYWILNFFWKFESKWEREAYEAQGLTDKEITMKLLNY